MQMNTSLFIIIWKLGTSLTILDINSRFVSKGPIHNLLNSMAASFQCSLAQKSDKLEFQSKKRQRTLGYPAFLLNLCCPISSYDLNFEPSKTVIEFKVQSCANRLLSVLISLAILQTLFSCSSSCSSFPGLEYYFVFF